MPENNAETTGSEYRAMVMGHDWSKTPLGPSDAWPQSLRSTVDLILGTRHPMCLSWGPEMTLVYNEPYAAFLGLKHPSALGHGMKEVWRDVWEEIEPLVHKALRGEATWAEDFHLTMERNGYPEDTWWSFSYSPARDDSGAVVGMLNVSNETTAKVQNERRQTFRLALESQIRGLADPSAIVTAAVTALGRHLGAQRVGYGLVLADDATIRLTSGYVEGVSPLDGDFPLESFGRRNIERMRAGQIEVCPDILDDSSQDPAVWAAIDTRAFVSVPMVVEGRFRASLFVNSREPRRWSAEDSVLITEVAARIWDAVERAEAGRRAAGLQERQRQMLLQMPGFVGMLAGPDLVYEYVNDAYVAISERTDFIGRRFRDVFPDIEGQGFFEIFDKAFTTGEGLVLKGMELRLHGREEVQYVDFVLEPIRDETGAVTVLFVGGYETTDVYRGAAALRASEARLRDLNADLEQQVVERTRELARTWEVSPDLMGVANDRGYFESSNPAWRNMLGWTEAEVASTLLFDFLHPDDVGRTQDRFARAIDHGEPSLRFENRYRDKDGAYRWISWIAVPEGGKIYCTGRDISAEKEAEAERDRLWTLSEDMLARADYEGGMSAVNPAWAKTLGYTEHRLLTEPYADIIHPDDVPATVAAIQEMKLTGQPTRFENDILASNGDWKPIGWTVSPEADGVHFIAVGRDLTQDKARERALLETQEALRQSQKLDAMGQLTGGVAHDFNNLLTPIIGSLDMLMRRGVGTERERRLMDGALQSAERAKTLVQRLLAFARRQPLQASPVDLSALMKGMAGLIGSTLGPSIDVKVDLADGLPAAMADPNQLEMAILNLSVNARDAMPSGGTLTIGATRESIKPGVISSLRVGHYVRLSVSDTGVGMDEATLTRAVEPFFSTKGVGKGTGLGLSMAHGLAMQLGGELTITSVPGKGTTVNLWLPVSAAAVEASEPGATAAVANGKGTALLVDDEDLVRMTTADMLGELGYDVVEASSAEEAMRMIDGGFSMDLLVTDHLMPGMSGADLARTLSARFPGLPTLIVSGYADTEGLPSDLRRLTKPFRHTDLGEILASMEVK